MGNRAALCKEFFKGSDNYHAFITAENRIFTSLETALRQIPSDVRARLKVVGGSHTSAIEYFVNEANYLDGDTVVMVERVSHGRSKKEIEEGI